MDVIPVIETERLRVRGHRVEDFRQCAAMWGDPVLTRYIGGALSPRWYGRGYATEAVRAAAAWGDRRFDAARTVCLIHPENLASVCVARKCGYRELPRVTYKGQPTLMFERLMFERLMFERLMFER